MCKKRHAPGGPHLRSTAQGTAQRLFAASAQVADTTTSNSQRCRLLAALIADSALTPGVPYLTRAVLPLLNILPHMAPRMATSLGLPFLPLRTVLPPSSPTVATAEASPRCFPLLPVSPHAIHVRYHAKYSTPHFPPRAAPWPTVPPVQQHAAARPSTATAARHLTHTACPGRCTAPTAAHHYHHHHHRR